ncbi:ferredoxin [Actinacidiphila oryziradicis]|uniref:ferredoxin n=1 Tax=Actinacidiphila oryziradicis TaxID=2571141 RepID=UPI001B808DC4|nr:ferredoxin [Actinacidiphila oryziradicis]
MLKLAIDPGKCEGHARCVARASALFDVDDEGQSFALANLVPAGQEDAARSALEACPERAITITEV